MPAVTIALVLVLALLGVGIAAIAARRWPQRPRAVYVGMPRPHAGRPRHRAGAARDGPPGGSDVTLPLGLPWLGAHFRLDHLSAFFLLVVNLAGALASLYALGYAVDGPAPLAFSPAFRRSSPA